VFAVVAMSQVHPAERFFSSAHPISKFLTIDAYEADDRSLTVRFKAPSAFVEIAASGRIFSGLATLVLDTILGGAVMGSLKQLQPIATVGLTTRHMRRPKSGEALACSARVVGTHAGMAHVTGELTAADGEILSTATGVFMIGTRAKPLGERV
jgi:acyl-coenzyme A thioesterase PaaI-like protein